MDGGATGRARGSSIERRRKDGDDGGGGEEGVGHEREHENYETSFRKRKKDNRKAYENEERSRRKKFLCLGEQYFAKHFLSYAQQEIRPSTSRSDERLPEK